MACWLCVLSPVHAREASATPPEVFSFRVDGPSELSDWLTQHLELQRYKTLQDLDETELQRLLQSADEQAHELLATQGYFSPVLKWQTLPGQSAGPAHQVTLSVTPGPRSTVRDVQITWEGDITRHAASTAQKAALLKQWSLPAGQVFTQTAWNQAKAATLRQLSAENFPLARLHSSQALVDPDTHSVTLTLQFDSGPLVLLGEVQVTGSERYGQEQAVRLARIRTGQAYRQSDLLEAQQRLVASSFYDSVFVSLDTEGASQAMPVKIELKEALRQKWVVGVGVRSDNGPA